MSEFRPMNECKGFNMERVLLKNKNGYMITVYFKDGMLQCDGDEDWTRPIAWDRFIRLRDLANGVKSKNANCAIFDTSKMLPTDYIDAEMVKRWHAKLIGLGYQEMILDIEAMAKAYDWEKNIKWE
jgi:hypothetical protein